jgi:hypothetical protein
MRIGYSLRHIHDPVLSSLKMKGIRLSFFCSLFPYPPTTRAPTRAYVKRMKDNEMRHVVHDTRISSGQCPRRDVTVRYGLQGHTEYTPEERHIHVRMKRKSNYSEKDRRQ